MAEQTLEVYPSFFVRQVPMPKATEEAGKPVFKAVEYVEIIIPGDKHSRPVYKVTAVHREKYADHYDRFIKGVEQKRSGTPLEHWGRVTDTQVAEMNAVSIFTIQDLALLDDGKLQGLGSGGNELREQAKVYLTMEVDRRGAEEQSIRALRAEEENDKLTSKVDEMSNTIALMGAQLKVLTAGKESVKAVEDLLAGPAGEDEGDSAPQPGSGTDETPPENPSEEDDDIEALRARAAELKILHTPQWGADALKKHIKLAEEKAATE